MTSAEFSPAPFAVPSAATPNDAAPSVTLPDLEYTLYQPQQLKSRIPALMIHGFATRGDQLYGGTGWIRQYLRAGYPVLAVNLPYHTNTYLKDPQFTVDCKLPAHTQVMSSEIPFDSVPSVNTTGQRLTPIHLLTNALAQLLRAVATENNLDVELQPRAHVIGFSFGARVGWELALTHPEAVASSPSVACPYTTTSSPCAPCSKRTRAPASRRAQKPRGRLHRRGDCVLHLDY